jgi:hypothetical protein
MPTARDYELAVESVWNEKSTAAQRRNVHPNLAKSFVRAMWKQEMGGKLPWRIHIGSGNRRTWMNDYVFTVNPDQGWHDINHDMGHFIERRGSGGAHTDNQVRLEAAGARLICRRFLRDEPYVDPKKGRDHVAIRAVQVDAGIKRWDAKLKRAATALKKLKRKKRYYDKVLTERSVQ